MLISAALAAQLRMFTTGLTAARGQLFTNNEWREYREAYTLLSLLVKKVDSHINSIIMLSVSSNVYFICAQLITEIDSIKHSYFRTLFYMYSSLFLVFRTTVVVMQAAAINDETKRIPPELYLCPQQSYCVEWCIPGYSCLLNPNILVSEYGTTVSWSFVDSICLNVFNRNENCHRL
uniref:Gustatory receptor for sugar taste 64f n=1 Tax=Cacopsylla melanoneura TaxID=428564 RepID=A0A8D8QDI7_9HEMI